MRVGLISDTHSAGSGKDLPSQVLKAFEGVDLILHCGDLECLGVLDVLESVAPVLAVRGFEDPIEPGDRLARVTRVVQVEDVAIGMIHDIQWPSPHVGTGANGDVLEFPPGSAKDLLAKKFGQPVDVVLFGDTHEEMICIRDGVLLVNPGSPTYPGRTHRSGSMGTVGILDIQGATTLVSLVQLTGER
jgi:putative phosphoesterase